MSRRTLTLSLAAAETLYFVYTYAFGYLNDNPLGDGMNWMPAFFATPAFVVTTLPAGLLAAFGKAPRVALALAVAGIFLVPLIYWQFLLPGLFSLLFP